MNPGILTSGYAPPAGPRPLLGSPAPLEMIDAYGYDADALRYIRSVEAADGQRLPLGVRVAVNEFVVGCKADGIWDALKACCILMGARTLAGALTPLTGAAPTNVNFVSGDYNRRTGLKGNGSTKYINTNRLPLDDGVSDHHMSIWITESVASANQAYMGNSSLATGATNLIYSAAAGSHTVRMRNSSAQTITGAGLPYTGFFGANRRSPNAFTARIAQRTSTFTLTAETPAIAAATFVYGRSGGGGIEVPSDPRLAFYSIGSSIALPILESRVSALVTAIQAAIPA